MKKRNKTKGKIKGRHQQEHFFEDDGWVEFGGELYYAVDWTSGGAPIGLSMKQMQEMEEIQGELVESEPVHHLAYAKGILEKNSSSGEVEQLQNKLSSMLRRVEKGLVLK